MRGHEDVDVYEAVDSRRAVRAFSDDPVPKDVLERVLNAATRAPSSGNLQPWHLYVVTGEPLAELKRRATTRALAGDPGDEQIERLEQELHLAIALATGNVAIAAGVEELWSLRQQSPLCMTALRRARAGSGGNFVAEHRQIVAALRERDPKAARRAIHAHVAQVIDDLLALAEADALQQTRQKMAEQRRALARRNEI